jgi:hypothetical protein
MNALSELQSCIDSFVAGRISLQDFENWLVDSMWDIEKEADKQTLSVFEQIEGVLAEASHAKWDEDSLRQELAAATRPLAGPSF